MAISQRTRVRRVARRAPAPGSLSRPARPSGPLVRVRPLTSPGQIAVIYRWGAWALALGLIVSGSTTQYGREWARRGDVFLLLGLTLAVNVLLTVALRPYMRLMRRFPAVLALDVAFCLIVYFRSNIWTSPFQFYSYASLMLPVAIFFFGGALAGSLLFLALDVALLYVAGDSFSWAQANGWADTYLMQLAIVPLLAFVYAYPNRLYAQLRRAQQRLDAVEREQLLIAERTRIAQSLHDSVAQMLFGIRMLTESAMARLSEHATASAAPAGVVGEASRLEPEGEDDPANRAPLADTLRQIRDLATRGNHEMRRAIYALNEPGPSRRGLVVSLKAMLADLAARTGAETFLTAPGPAEATRKDAETGAEAAAGADEKERREEADEALLPDPVAQALYNVAREALANVEKHAGAMNVWVELRVQPAAAGTGRRAVLTVRDDGRGFRLPPLAQPGDPDEDERGAPHFGLGNMRRAAESAGGRLEVSTGVGRGTTVVASVPVP
jgi:signal transduction histidine kinase